MKRQKWLAAVAVLVSTGNGFAQIAEQAGQAGEGGLRVEPGMRGATAPRQGVVRIQAAMEELRRQKPEEFRRLMELRKTDPQAFKAELRQHLGRGRRFQTQGPPGAEGGRGGPRMMRPGNRDPLEQRCQELGRQVRNAETQEDKDRLLVQLATAVDDAFTRRIDEHRTRLTQMEKQLEAMRTSIAQREANQDQICQRRVDELTRDPALNWNAPPSAPRR